MRILVKEREVKISWIIGIGILVIGNLMGIVWSIKEYGLKQTLALSFIFYGGSYLLTLID